MAVKVVGPPKIHNATCRPCGAELEFTALDVTRESFCCMGDTETSNVIVCPTCGSYVIVKVSPAKPR